MILFALLLQAAPMATHADQPIACPAAPTAPRPGWTALTPVVAGASAGKAAALPLGKAARARLLPAGSVTLPVATTKPAGAGSHSGVFAFSAATPGRYRVALGAGVWVDVIANGVALRSVAHAHGPTCSPIRKTVDYDLQPGRYLVEVVGSTEPTLSLMVGRMR